MSCYITYNNKNYTEKDFKEYLKSLITKKQTVSKPKVSSETLEYRNIVEKLGQENFDKLVEGKSFYISLLNENPSTEEVEDFKQGEGDTDMLDYSTINKLFDVMDTYLSGKDITDTSFIMRYDEESDNNINYTFKQFMDYFKEDIKTINPQIFSPNLGSLFDNIEDTTTVKEETTSKPQPKFWTRESVAAQPDKIFLFGDNFEDAKTGYVPSSTQAVIRGLPNAIGISTKFNRRTNTDSFMDDSTYEEFKEHVDKQIETAIELAEETGKTIIVPENGIGTGKAQLEKRAPKSFAYLKQELDKLREVQPKVEQKEVTPTPTPPKQATVITPEMIRARVKSSFDKNGYMDIKEENRGDKVILGAITRYIMGTKGIVTNNQILEANKTFKLKDEVTLETVKEGVLRIKIKEDIVEETPKPLGGLNMSKLTSSGESMANDALSNVEQAFKCK